MKLSSISPPPPGRGSKRAHSKSADRGGYSWELGYLVFDDPPKATRKRKKVSETWRPKKQTGGDKARNNYHRKHG